MNWYPIQTPVSEYDWTIVRLNSKHAVFYRNEARSIFETEVEAQTYISQKCANTRSEYKDNIRKMLNRGRPDV